MRKLELGGPISIIFAPARGRTRRWSVSEWSVRVWVGLGTLAILSVLTTIPLIARVVYQASELQRIKVENLSLHKQLASIDGLEKELDDLAKSNRDMRRLVGLEPASGVPESLSTAGTATLRGLGRSRPKSIWMPSVPHFPPHLGPISRGYSSRGIGEPFHPGVDVSGSVGMPIVAAGAGIVRTADTDSIYGKHIVIDHGGGLTSVYGHASLLLVAAGDTVYEGQRIALLGSTGRSSAPHLHFEILRNGNPIDPGVLIREYARR